MDEHIEAVQRMQDYIAENIDGDITPAGLACASMYSPWYSHRLFMQLTGIAPARYVRRLRLSRAALELKNGASSVTDAAFGAGFDSVEGFQRAFHREFGRNPGEYSEQPTPIRLFRPYGVKASIEGRNITMEREVKTVYVELTERPARKAVIKRGVKADNYFDYCGEVGCDVWGVLLSMDSLCGEPVSMWLPDGLVRPGTSKYVQGIEADMNYVGPVPDGFDVIDLPASKYLMFRGEPFREENYGEAIADVWQAIERYDPAVTGYEWRTDAPRIQLEPIGERGYIEYMPVNVKK